MEIAEILKENRLQRKFTQEEVAEKIFVSQKSVSNWERGKTFPDIDSLIRLAKLYELSLDTILLEGSGIVREMKRKEQVYSLQKWSLLGPQITNLLLFAMLMVFGQVKNPDLAVKINFALLFFTIISSTVTNLYFQRELKKAEAEQYGDPKIRKVNLILFGLFMGYCVLTVMWRLVTGLF